MKKRTPRELGYIHQHSIRNRAALEQSDRCGCFHCERMFSPAEVQDWIDGDPDGGPDAAVTALCPHCDIDAVLPSAAPITLTAELLAAMRKHYF